MTGMAGDLDKLKNRLQALRAKTIANGCTEEEALAAAAKLAVERYGFDEVRSGGPSHCMGEGGSTGRWSAKALTSCARWGPPMQ